MRFIRQPAEQARAARGRFPAAALSPPRSLGVLPFLGVSLLPPFLLLAVMGLSMDGEAQSIRLPRDLTAHPPLVRATPMISVRLSRQGVVTLAGQAAPDGALAATWERERRALRLLGFEPSQAKVVIRADADTPTRQVRRLMEAARAAGFTQCVLRPMESQDSQQVQGVQK